MSVDRLLLESGDFLLLESGDKLLLESSTAGIAFDAASNSGYQTADNVYTWNHTCAGSDRYLVVGIALLSVGGSTVSGVTYNGVAMTTLGATGPSLAARAELWGLIAPATGTNVIEVTLDAALDSVGCATSFTGVHQTTSTEGFNGSTAINGGVAADATVDVTTVADNDWVVDIVATSDTAITVGSGQTQRANVTGAVGSGTQSTEGPKTPAGSVTMSWTAIAALAEWSISAVALRPVAASGLGTMLFHPGMEGQLSKRMDGGVNA